MLRRAVVAGSVAFVALWLLPGTGGAALHHPRIRPDQLFVGSINGSIGQPKPATIKVICPGPVGGSGHPLAGQTVEVGRVPGPVPDAGFTGKSATSISAFFGAPPPTPGAIGPVTFTRYGVSQTIPTSISVPCGGSGQVTFVPFPQSPPTSRAAIVPVVFANIAATPSR